jgi:nitrite reductase/ring-hydroxylating ferredoxin subunit
MTGSTPITLCRLDELADPGSRGLVISHAGSDYDVFVVRRGNQAHAYLNRCPHTGAPLDWVQHQFLSHDQCHIQCAMHAALFRIEDGVCVAGPCTGDALTRLPVAIEHGTLVLLPAQFLWPGQG